jgi:outer membrane receptor for ferrienterochelin and colicins
MSRKLENTGKMKVMGHLFHIKGGTVLTLLVAAQFMSSARANNTNSRAAAGQDLTQMSIEALMQIEVPTISSASKFAQKATAAPASVTVVSADEIQHYGYLTLADTLQSVPGFNISYDRNYAFLGVRGLSLGDFNSRILLLVDGHRVNNNLTDGASIDNSFILDMDLVDHVEIIRGPSAVLYGNNAFFGVINVVTRQAAQLNGFEVSGQYGSFDSYRARVSYGKVFTNGLEMLLSGSFYDSAGVSDLFYPEYNSPAHNFGVAEYRDREWAASAFGSLRYRDFTLEGAFNRRDKDNPTAQYFTTFNAPGLRTEDDRAYVNLKFDHEFPDIVDVNAQVYWDYNDHFIGYPFSAGPYQFLYDEMQRGEWWGAELQVSKKLWDKHTFTIGGEYRDDFLQHDRLYDALHGPVYTDSNRTRQSYGAYGEAELEIFKPLHLNGGVRYDQYGDFDPTVNPRVALIYDPFEKTTLKAIYGTAFRAPNFIELSDPRFQNISPENITSYELVYEQGIGKNLRSAISGFHNEMEDLIVFANGRYNNLNAESTGVELALEAGWTNGLKGRASYTLQHAENENGSLNLPDAPSQLVKFNVSAPIIKEKLFASLEVQFTDRRRTYSTSSSGKTVPGLDVEAYNTVNFTLYSHNLLKNLDVSATVYNLFDEHYSDPATPSHLQSQIQQDGRSFGMKLTYRF